LNYRFGNTPGGKDAHWRRYLVDHELSHCGVAKPPRLEISSLDRLVAVETVEYEFFIVPHALEDFPEV